MYMRDEVHFKQAFRNAVRNRRISYNALANLTGINEDTIANYMCGRAQPSLYNGLVILDALGYKRLQDILHWYDPNGENVDF